MAAQPPSTAARSRSSATSSAPASSPSRRSDDIDLQLTDEQTMLQGSVDELLAREPEERLWPALVEFGALEVGDGIGVVELALVARSIGAHLAVVPYIDTAAVRYAIDVGDAA